MELPDLRDVPLDPHLSVLAEGDWRSLVAVPMLREGRIVGAMVVGVLESLAAGYLDPVIGGGFGTVASWLVLVTVLVLRPHGLFGTARVERV